MRRAGSAVLLALLMLSGCASTPTIQTRLVSKPPLNMPATAYLGDRLLMQAHGFYTDVLTVGNINGKFAQIEAGMYCRNPHSGEYFSFKGRTIRYLNFLGGTRGYDRTLTYKEAKNEVCLDDFWSGCFDSSYGKIQHRKNALCSDPTAFQRVIEYNGRAGDVLNFTYREFRHDRIRGAFTTNFTMDHSKGDVVAYKGARLKVLEATNQKIVYVVLKNFDSPR